MGSAIEFRHVGVSYAREKTHTDVLKDINLQIQPGEIFGLIGQSGAGKSTLLRLVNALTRPTSGEVHVDGILLEAQNAARVRQIQRRIGTVFQSFNLLSSRTAFQNVALPLILQGQSKAAIRARVRDLLDYVDLAKLENHYPSQLSGGQKQRVGIARAIASKDTSLLLCDEATSALDPPTTRQILDLVARVNREHGLTVLLVTHEMSVIQRICHRVAVLDHGELIETGTVLQVFGAPQHAKTRELLRIHTDDISPRIDTQTRRITFTVSGAAPAMIDAAHDSQSAVHASFRFARGTVSATASDNAYQLVADVHGEDDAVQRLIRTLESAPLGPGSTAKNVTHSDESRPLPQGERHV